MQPESSSMKWSANSCSSVRRFFIFCLLLAFGTGLPAATQKPKLPRPRILEHEIRIARDPSTGEMRAIPAEETEPGSRSSAPVIRSRVALVEVQCTVTAPDGTRVRGLTQKDFRLSEDGVAQQVVSFDAATVPASIALVIDASPSIYRELGAMRGVAQSLAKSLQPEDEVAVVAFADETQVLLPFSRDRNLLDAALTSPELVHVANSSQSFIYQAAYLTAVRLFSGRAGRKAMVLLTDGQDSALGLTWDPESMLPAAGANKSLTFQDVARAIAASGIEMYVISTELRPRTMTADWLSAHEEQTLVTPAARGSRIPLYTLYLAELTRQVGGELYFLREVGSLAEIYHTIALKLEAEYTLGYYPAAGIAKPGWRKLQVELRPDERSNEQVPANSQITHRTAYYVPGSSR
jgi:Ca-activated chloride channel family protein